MAIALKDYEAVVGAEVIDELRVVAGRVRHRRLQNINSTPVGGGVAEILTRMVPLLRELGIETSWDVIKGDQAFFNVTKAFHNALHGKAEEITEDMLDIYRANTEMNLREMNFSGDVILIHDPQPAGLILRKPEIGRKWLWRCHIDISSPDPTVWNFLKPYIERYDASIFSMPDFAQQLPTPQFMVAPSIDPLSDKNKELEKSYINNVLEKYHLDPERPMITQISRFDRLKDPLGVMAAYRIVKKRYDCQLVLAGGGASDDPEGEAVLREVREKAADDPDIHVLLLPPFSDLEINALVRGSTIVMQKSIKEGFGLTVSEALWKRKPVIGGAVGGIKLQIINGVTGFLVHSPEGAAHRAVQLLADHKLRERMGENGFLHVKQNFLLTRHVKDYMLVMLALEHPDEDVVHLD
ncbi:glycosyltransferase [candidate division KSB1 bacterium]|nr:glycosyltransferase [candidate division KSB1 bacterium]